VGLEKDSQGEYILPDYDAYLLAPDFIGIPVQPEDLSEIKPVELAPPDIVPGLTPQAREEEPAQLEDDITPTIPFVRFQPYDFKQIGNDKRYQAAMQTLRRTGKKKRSATMANVCDADAPMGGDESASSERLRQVRAKGEGKGTGSGPPLGPPAGLHAGSGLPAGPAAPSGPAAAPSAAAPARVEPTLTPEEMFRQILRGQGEVTATVNEFKASVSHDLQTMDTNIDATTSEVKILTEQMKQAQLNIQKLQNADAQSATSGFTRIGSGGTGGISAANQYIPNWQPSYIEFKGWISREGWNNREIKQREGMKHNTLTDNITDLLGLCSLDALHHAAFDGIRTVRENTGRYWPYTRGRIYFPKGTNGDLLWEVRNCFDSECRQGNALLPANVRFQLESSPWKLPHIQAVGRFQGTFADAKKTVGTACKGEPGPPKTYIWFMQQPREDPDTRVLIAEWGVHSGWELNATNLAAVEPDLDQAALLVKLNGPTN